MDDKKIKYSHPVPPFVRYCSATIPTMFDDSLSYYEALCALWKWLQTNLVNVVNNNAAVTQEYIALVNELKDFVDNYFENLDVQEEINHKLDEMVENGTLGNILDALLEPIRENIADFETRVNGELVIFRNKLNQFDASPVAVSDMGDMTDHNQIYVLTTDGNWYYYDSDSSAFVSGGAYQSTQLTNLDDEDMASKGLTTKSISFYNGYELSDDYVNDAFGYYQEGMQIGPQGYITKTD